MKLALACLAFALALSGLAQTDTRPDLDVTFIQITPRYPGYIAYYDAPGKQGVPVNWDNVRNKPISAEEEAKIKRWHAPGDTVTFTANIVNHGDATAPRGWEYAWLIDGKEIARGTYDQDMPVGGSAKITQTWEWQSGRHTVKFFADPMLKRPDYSLHNNTREDFTDAWALLWFVDRRTYDGFAANRNLLGTKSFEDWAQWHIDWMNHLINVSKSPLKPNGGTRARVRCDYIVVLDDVERDRDKATGGSGNPLVEGWDGAWGFGRHPNPAQWASAMDWGLIHEWGHQLGLTDLYALDRAPENNLVPDEGGDPLLIGHMSSLTNYMMHGHGPVPFSPLCAAAMELQYGVRRGYYGNYYFMTPKRNILNILDNQGKPVSNADLTFYQDRDTRFEIATFKGTTNTKGQFELPNRPAPSITTPGGFTQRDNPFGQINVVGSGDTFFIKIQARGHTEYTFMDIPEFALAYLGDGGNNKERAVYTRKTNIPPPGAPPAPTSARGNVEAGRIALTWDAVPDATSYKVYRADPPEYRFKPVHSTAEAQWNESAKPGSLYRYAITAVGDRGRESGFSNVAGVLPLGRPWGLVVTKDGRRYIRDRANGQMILQKPDGSIVGLMGSVHNHLEEATWDVGLDSKGRLVFAKGWDGYNPNPGIFVEDPARNLELVVSSREKPAGSGEGQLDKPMGVTVDSKDDVYIADTGNNRISVFDIEGRFKRVISDDFKAPQKVAFGTDGTLYVADTGNNRIVAMTRNPDQSFSRARVIEVEAPQYVLALPDGRLLVSAVDSARLFDTSGRPAWRYPQADAKSTIRPAGLALDGNGNLLIIDTAAPALLSVRLPQ